MHRQAGVDDLVDEEHMAPFDLDRDVLQEADALAAFVGVAVAGELDEVERVMDRQRAREIADERDAGLQRADQDRFEPGEVARDFLSEPSDSRRKLVGVEENLSDPLVEQAQDAFRRPYRAASRSKSRS
jgi:hypothetical protein